MSLQALIFDVDGTLADTERAGHRVAFNAAFADAGLPWHWDEGLYDGLLQVTGGKERIRHFIANDDRWFLARPDATEVIADLHRSKTRHYLRLLGAGSVRLLPGVESLLREARGGGLRLAIATTTTPDNVTALSREHARHGCDVMVRGDRGRRRRVGQEARARHLPVGDRSARARATAVLAVEDSGVGLAAAASAGVPTVVTPSAHTVRDDFTAAIARYPDLSTVTVDECAPDTRPRSRPPSPHHPPSPTKEPSYGPVSAVRRPQPERRRPDRRRQAHPVRVQDEAQGRSWLSRLRRPLRGGSSTGTNVEVSTTDDFTKGVDALVYHIDEATEDMRIAYPLDLFDRNITDGRMMLVSFLTLTIGNNQGMGDIEYAKMHRLLMPPRCLQPVRRPGHGHRRPVAHPRPPGRRRRLHRRHHHQAQAGPASRALRRGGLPVLAGRRLHQERRAAGQPGVRPDEEDHPAGRRRHEARPGRDRSRPSCSRRTSPPTTTTRCSPVPTSSWRPSAETPTSVAFLVDGYVGGPA